MSPCLYGAVPSDEQPIGQDGVRPTGPGRERMMMPERPRSHVLEDLSVRAFTGALPAEWPRQEVRRDYGVDLRVEIFEGGRATGMAFWAQLKATDEADADKARRTRFDVSALNYMAAQAEPVLLVRYAASSGRLYGAWLHAQDLLLRREEQKTLTFTWSPEQVLTTSSPSALLDEVRRFRVFSRSMTRVWLCASNWRRTCCHSARRSQWHSNQ